MFDSIWSDDVWLLAPLALRYSNRFCFSMTWRRAFSPLWLDLKQSLVTSLYFSRLCYVKGRMLPCNVINSEAWFIIACIVWRNMGVMVNMIKSWPQERASSSKFLISEELRSFAQLEKILLSCRSLFHNCCIFSTLLSSRPGRSFTLITWKSLSFSGPVKYLHFNCFDVCPS